MRSNKHMKNKPTNQSSRQGSSKTTSLAKYSIPALPQPMLPNAVAEELSRRHPSTKLLSVHTSSLDGKLLIFTDKGIYSYDGSEQAWTQTSPLETRTSLSMDPKCETCKGIQKLFEDNFNPKITSKYDSRFEAQNKKLEQISKMFKDHINYDHHFRDKVNGIKKQLRKLCDTSLNTSRDSF